MTSIIVIISDVLFVEKKMCFLLCPIILLHLHLSWSCDPVRHDRWSVHANIPRHRYHLQFLYTLLKFRAILGVKRSSCHYTTESVIFKAFSYSGSKWIKSRKCQRLIFKIKSHVRRNTPTTHYIHTLQLFNVTPQLLRLLNWRLQFPLADSGAAAYTSIKCNNKTWWTGCNFLSLCQNTPW